MTDPKLKASLDRDWISLGLYALIWVLWIIALVRNPVHALGFVVILAVVANPFIGAFRTKDGKTVLRAPNRTGRRVVLAIVTAIVAIQAFDVMKNVDLQQHPMVIIGGFMAFAAFFVLAFVVACIRGMRSQRAAP